MPCTYVLSEECAAAVAEFVRGGGHVIADYILAEKRPGGLCYTSLPGGGLDRVFGIEREDVLFIAHPVMERENSLGIETGSMIEQIVLTDAESVGGEYMPEYPLVAKNTYGRGSATYIATQFFAHYARKPACALREVLLGMLGGFGIKPHAELEAEDKKAQSALITGEISSDDGAAVITVTNTDYETVSDTLILPGDGYRLVEDLGRHTVTVENGQTAVKFNLGAMESLAIYRDR
jgi:hypothetical protein